MVRLRLSVCGKSSVCFYVLIVFCLARVKKKAECKATFGIILLYLTLLVQFYLVIEMKAIQIAIGGDEMMLANNYAKQKEIF